GTAARLLPFLIMSDQLEAARSTLSRTDPLADRPESQEAWTLMTAALALGDDAAFGTWFLRWFEVALTKSGTVSAAAAIESQVRELWGFLDPEVRAKARELLVSLESRSSEEQRAGIAMVRSRLARDLGIEAAAMEPAKLEQVVEEGATRSFHEAVNLVLAAP